VTSSGVAVVVALGLIACGGDDDAGPADSVASTVDDAGAQAYVDAFVTGFQQTDDDDVVITSEQAECLGPRFVDVLRAERLEAAGVTPDRISTGVDLDFAALGLEESDGDELYDAFGACDLDLRESLLTGMAGSDAEARACVEETLTDEMVRTFFVTSIVQGVTAAQSDPDVQDALTAVFAACLPTAEGSTPTTAD